MLFKTTFVNIINKHIALNTYFLHILKERILMHYSQSIKLLEVDFRLCFVFFDRIEF